MTGQRYSESYASTGVAVTEPDVAASTADLTPEALSWAPNLLRALYRAAGP